MAGNPYYSGPISDHFDGSTFFNPEGVPPRSFRDLVKWQLGGGTRARWPVSWPSPFEPVRPEERLGGKHLRVTMVGHATLLVQVSGLNILTDPVWSKRASPFSFAGPKRVNPPGIPFEELPPIDLVLLSHNHYDHLDGGTLARLQALHDPLVITPLGNDTIVRRHAPAMRIHAGDWGDRVEVGEGVVIHFEPAHHWSARGARDRRMALWSAFAIATPAGNFYHIGDTGFHSGRNYRSAARKHGGFRLAILPIGAYEPRWFMEAQHQNPEEAVEGMGLANAAYAAGHHWGTFQLTNEAIEEPREKLSAALAAAGVAPGRFRAMRPGEVWDVPETAAFATNR